MFLKHLYYSIFYLPFAPMKQDDTIDKQIDSAKDELQQLCNLLSDETRTWLQKFNRPKDDLGNEFMKEEEEEEEVDTEFE